MIYMWISIMLSGYAHRCGNPDAEKGNYGLALFHYLFIQAVSFKLFYDGLISITN
jgi:hypothetical protein